MVPHVSLPAGKFEVKPGQTKTAQFNFQVPTLNSSRLPVYSGSIVIKSSNHETLKVPYLGVGSDVKSFFKNMFNEGFPTIFTGARYPTIDEKSNFTFNLDPAVADYPRVLSAPRYGSAEVRWDIFEHGWTERNWSYPPTPGKKGYLGSATTWNYANILAPPFDPQHDSPDDLSFFPLLDESRATFDNNWADYWWFGKFANGSYIQPGKYVMRLAYLIPFGDRTHSDNWSTYTRNFEVLRRK